MAYYRSHGTVSLVGHSFVRRLRDAIRGQKDYSLKANFGIQNVRVQYVCRGGWKLRHIQDNISKVVAQAPDIVILQCGTNDLCSCSSPLSLVNALLNPFDPTGYLRSLSCTTLRSRGLQKEPGIVLQLVTNGSFSHQLKCLEIDFVLRPQLINIHAERVT